MVEKFPGETMLTLDDIENKYLVSSSIQELIAKVGNENKFGAIEKIDENDLLEKLNKALISVDDLNYLVNAEIRTIDKNDKSKGLLNIDDTRLMEIRNKLTPVFGGTRIEAGVE